ncbi:MAG: hypothetical protein NXI31_22940 [bacterium]|nr:hypothetical protein [bacterium]
MTSSWSPTASRRARGRQVEVAAYALANGRLAFRAELPAVAQRLVVTDAGIAVMGRKYAVVHDRFGPRVLTVDGVTFDIRGGKDGWFVLRPYELEAFDRAGKSRWQVQRPFDVRTAAALEILPDGGVLTWKRDLNVDKGVGFVCRSPVDGSTRWRSDVASPGKFESPYRLGRVEVRATARGIYLLSLTSTGSVVAELSPKTGEQKKLVDLRPKPKRRVRRRLPAKGR